jgi:hypothetical protein
VHRWLAREERRRLRRMSQYMRQTEHELERLKALRVATVVQMPQRERRAAGV